MPNKEKKLEPYDNDDRDWERLACMKGCIFYEPGASHHNAPHGDCHYKRSGRRVSGYYWCRHHSLFPIWKWRSSELQTLKYEDELVAVRKYK